MARIPVMIALLLVAAGARASDASCNVESDYDLTINDASVILTRDRGTPKWIVIRKDRLFVDDRWVELVPADRARLASFDAGAREAMPLASAIGRDAADIAFTALGEVAAGFSADPARTRARLGQARQKIDARIASSISATRFSGDDLGDGIGEAVGEVMPTLIGEIVGGAAGAALSGDTSRLQAMQGLDKKIEAQVQPRAKALEARAEQLCTRMLALDQIEESLDYRLPGGGRLDMLQVRRGAR